MGTEKKGFRGMSKEQELSAAATGRNAPATDKKPCNPSVCVGGAQPTSCYCPIPERK